MYNKTKLTNNQNLDKNSFISEKGQNRNHSQKTPKKVLSPIEREFQEYVEQNKIPLPNLLHKLIEDKQIILIWECHSSECEPIRNEIATNLASLQNKWLTHVFLELDNKYQSIIDSLDFTQDNTREILQEKIPIIWWEKWNYDILIMAKLLWLKTILIDYKDWRKDSQKENAYYQNMRDSTMHNIIKDNMDENSKWIVFIWSDHVHKKHVRKYEDWYITPLGQRLTETYWDKNITSIRQLNQSSGFDDLLFSKLPSPKSISKWKNEVITLKDSWIVKWDPRVTWSDYIVTMV